MLRKGPDLNYALEVAFVILLAMNHRSDSPVGGGSNVPSSCVPVSIDQTPPTETTQLFRKH